MRHSQLLSLISIQQLAVIDDDQVLGLMPTLLVDSDEIDARVQYKLCYARQHYVNALKRRVFMGWSQFKD